jgi:hypothetical protein
MPTEEGMDPTFRSKLDALIAASGGRLYLTSGYRDHAQQQGLFDAAVKKYGSEEAARKYVALPGNSNHEKGYAADIGGDLDLLAQLAPQFGLELPMSWEPWHVEPVGLRTHSGTSPQAYPSSQPGTINPTQDTSLNQKPENLFASLSAIMNGTMITDAAKGKLTGETGATDVSAGVQNNGEQLSGRGSFTESSATPHGAVNPADLYKQLRAQGVDPVHAAALVAIAGRESSYDPTAHNGNAGTGDNSYGLFQINLINGMHSQFNPQMLSTTEGSVSAAAQLVKNGGLQPWGGYKGMSWANGTNLDAAAAASDESARDTLTSIAQSVLEFHGISVHVVALLSPGGILKTSSGKIRRRACRQALLEGALPVWQASYFTEAGGN